MIARLVRASCSADDHLSSRRIFRLEVWTVQLEGYWKDQLDGRLEAFDRMKIKYEQQATAGVECCC